MNDLDKIREEVGLLKKRNRRVEADKAWEGSYTRRFLIMVVTYIFVVLFFFTVGFENPFTNALVPSAGVLVSSLSIPLMKRYWVRYIYNASSASKMSSVSLGEVITDNVRVAVHVKILDDGSLMIYGYDSGKQVKRMKKDSDYEYEMVLSVSEKERLRQLLDCGDDERLLIYFKKNFEGVDGFEHLRKMLDANDIQYEYVSWD